MLILFWPPSKQVQKGGIGEKRWSRWSSSCLSAGTELLPLDIIFYKHKTLLALFASKYKRDKNYYPSLETSSVPLIVIIVCWLEVLTWFCTACLLIAILQHKQYSYYIKIQGSFFAWKGISKHPTSMQPSSTCLLSLEYTF